VWHPQFRTSLYSGILPTLFRDIPYSSCNVLIYTQIRNVLKDSTPFPSTVVSMICGMLSGTFTTAMTHPMDVVRIYMQLNRNHRCNVIKIISNKQISFFLQVCCQDSLNVEYLMLYHGLFLKIFDIEFTTHCRYLNKLHYVVHYTLLKYIRVIHRNFYNWL
jgi:hypothetical protein